jgi:autotransporter-associated beta strand protein
MKLSRRRRIAQPRYPRLLGIGLTAMAIATWTSIASAQTINGNSIALQSIGSASGTAWTLNSDGYLGTYIQVPSSAGGQVTFTINASGAQSNSIWPDMTLSVAGQNTSFSVNSTNPNTYSATLNLAGDTSPSANGTYFVRLQLDNQTGSATPDLTVNSLNVSGAAAVVNQNNPTLALESAQTFIDKYRQGQMNVTLLGAGNSPLPSGTPVQVKLVNSPFSLGSGVYDNDEINNFYNRYPWLTATASSTGNAALAYKYQQFVQNNFTTIEPETTGDWSSDEPTQGNVSMSFPDQIANYAEAHNLTLRMHALADKGQQPAFINNDFAADNVSAINSAVTTRIGYYVSANNTQPGSADGAPRTLAYQQLEILNESLHATGSEPNYIATLGYSGVANIFSQVANAVAAAGANTKLYTNDYNVLQYSTDPATNASDPYANWYLDEIQSINNAAGSKVVSGIGSELYATNQPVTPVTMQEAMQNLAVTGLPYTLNEFGIATGTSAATAAADLQNAFTMVYGNPNATNFDFWDFWSTLQANDGFLSGYEAGALMDANGNPTPLYTNTLLPMLEADGYVLPGSITPMNLTVGANGLVSFNGSYGTYDVTVDGKNYLLTYSPAGTSMTLMNVPEPTLTWNNTGGSGDGITWDSTSQNWNNGNGLITYGDNANVIFNDSNNSHYAVTLNTIVQPGSVVINNSSGNYTIAGSGGIAGTGSLTKSGSGSATLSTVNTYTGGTIITAGTLIIATNGALPANQPVTITGGTLQLAPNTGGETISSLMINGGGTFDLTNNHIVINYGNPADQATVDSTILEYITSGAIFSSQASGSYGIGWADGNDASESGIVAPDTVLIAYALYGDANLDGVVNGIDFTILVSSLGKSVSSWDKGDFNNDSVVNGIDFTELVANLGKSASGAAVALPAADYAAIDAFAAANGLMADVPEPTSASLLILIASLFAFRRRCESLRLCIECGYDVRTTPDRCPECGTIPPKKGMFSS